MKKFWKNVFIFCWSLVISALIIPDIDEGIRLVVMTICVMAGGISTMALLFPRVRKKGGGGEYQRLITASKTRGRRIR